MSSNSNYTVLIMQANTGITVQAPVPDSFGMDVASSFETALPQALTKNQPLALGAAIFGTRFAVQALTAQLWQGNSETQLSIELEFHTETDPVTDVRNPIVNLNRLVAPDANSVSGLLMQPGPSIDFSLQSIGGIAGNAATSVGNTAASISNTIFGTSFGTQPKPGALNNTNVSTSDGANSTVAAPATTNPQLGTAQYWKSRVKNQISIQIGNYLLFDSVVITNAQQTMASNFDANGLPHYAKVTLQFKPLFMLTATDINNIFLNPNATGSGATPNAANLGVSIPGANSSVFHL